MQLQAISTFVTQEGWPAHVIQHIRCIIVHLLFHCHYMWIFGLILDNVIKKGKNRSRSISTFHVKFMKEDHCLNFISYLFHSHILGGQKPFMLPGCGYSLLQIILQRMLVSSNDELGLILNFWAKILGVSWYESP